MSSARFPGRRRPRPCGLLPWFTATAVSVDHLQEGNHALRLAVGALMWRSASARTRRPVVAQAAGEFGQQRVFPDGLVVDAVPRLVAHGG